MVYLKAGCNKWFIILQKENQYIFFNWRQKLYETIVNHTNIEPKKSYIQFLEVVWCLKFKLIIKLVDIPYSHAVLNYATKQPVVGGRKHIWDAEHYRMNSPIKADVDLLGWIWQLKPSRAFEEETGLWWWGSLLNRGISPRQRLSSEADVSL